MKLGFPKSRLGWVFVGIYILSGIYMFSVIFVCMGNDPGNRLFCNKNIISEIAYLFFSPLMLLNTWSAALSNFSDFILLFNLLLPIIFYYWLGKGIEILFQKIRGAKTKGKK